MDTTIWVKICGVTSPRDAEMVARSGASAIGLNFVRTSPRWVSLATAQAIARAVMGQVELVGVFADESVAEMARMREEVGLDWLQLHGTESPVVLEQCGPRAMKALRVGDAADVAAASLFGGGRLLVDAKVAGALGGTGHALDWSLVEGLARQRNLVLAGGLRPDNVAEAVRQVRPFGVDTASGVEQAPGQKAADRTLAFVEHARSAARALRDPG
jgi:phosphoribosylanthranilate isomerase